MCYGGSSWFYNCSRQGFDTVVLTKVLFLGEKPSRILNEEGMISDLIEKSLKESVTAFETYCKNKYAAKKLSVAPNLTKEQILAKVGNTFQNIDRGSDVIMNDFSFDIRSALNPNDLGHVRKCFAKRHVLTHNSGIIDTKYIKDTNGNSSLLNRRVNVRVQEVKALLVHLQTIVSKC